MPTTTTIVELCDAISANLRSRGFFDEATGDAARRAAVHQAVDAAASELGLKLTMSERTPGSGDTVVAEEIPGLVTIVSQRRVAAPAEARGAGSDSIGPDFGVSWSLA